MGLRFLRPDRPLVTSFFRCRWIGNKPGVVFGLRAEGETAVIKHILRHLGLLDSSAPRANAGLLKSCSRKRFRIQLQSKSTTLRS
jgi:hypothetical protein